MTPTLETAVLALAVSQILTPLLNGLLARRATKHEQAADQVPLLAERMGTVASDVNDIKADMRRVAEHESKLGLVDLRLKALEDWKLNASPQLHQVANHTHILMGERSQRAAAPARRQRGGREGLRAAGPVGLSAPPGSSLLPGAVHPQSLENPISEPLDPKRAGFLGFTKYNDVPGLHGRGKTFDGRDVPSWDEIGPLAQARRVAAG